MLSHWNETMTQDVLGGLRLLLRSSPLAKCLPPRTNTRTPRETDRQIAAMFEDCRLARARGHCLSFGRVKKTCGLSRGSVICKVQGCEPEIIVNDDGPPPCCFRYSLLRPNLPTEFISRLPNFVASIIEMAWAQSVPTKASSIRALLQPP